MNGPPQSLRISHPFLDKDQWAQPDILRDDQVGTGDDKIVGSAPSMEVDLEIVVVLFLLEVMEGKRYGRMGLHYEGHFIASSPAALVSIGRC